MRPIGRAIRVQAHFFRIRQNLLRPWYAPFFAIIAVEELFFVIAFITVLAVINHNDLTLLLDPAKDLNFLDYFANSLPCGFFFFMDCFGLSIFFLLRKYWAKKDKEDEAVFIENAREEARKKREDEQKEAEQNQPYPPGFKLRHTLTGHASRIDSVAWSPDGQILASGSYDTTIRFWNVLTGQPLPPFIKHISNIYSVAWSPDGQILASGSEDQTIHQWSVQTGKSLEPFTGHTGYVNSIGWSPDGQILASGSEDHTVRLWNIQTGKSLEPFTGHTDYVISIGWSPDGQTLASASGDHTIRLWNIQTGKSLEPFTEHTNYVNSIGWSPDGQTLASASGDHTIRLWNIQTRQCMGILEGHTNIVVWVSFSPDGRLLGSKSMDGTVRLWRTDTWECISILYEYCDNWLASLSFHPTLPILATLGEEEKAIRIWDLDINAILNSYSSTSTSYTNAKVVLLGDSGVGKSGLALVLSNQPFSLTESTHARRIWNFDKQEIELNERRKENRETLLWDLAGQPGYRLIHQLHLNEVAVALVVFDARSETDPFAGVYHWDRALRQAQRVQGNAALPLKKILVQARVDRGGVSVSPERMQALIDECGFDEYFETSAKEGWHIADLRTAVCNAINWNSLPKISSTQLFQTIKSFLVSAKETGRYLSTVDDLYNEFLQSKDAPEDKEENLYAQFETCIGRVEAADLIKRLSFGKLVLLQPELLDAYASSLINVIRDEPDGLGSIEEERVRKGDFRMPGDERLKNKEHEELLLIAMVEDLLRRELALREEAFLVFPSQSTRENPDLPHPEGKAVVFDFEGPVLNIYATLAVRLSQSKVFKKKELWKNAITYNAAVGGMCGMFLHNIGEGRGELTLFFDKKKPASEETRFYFEEFVHTHLQRRAIPETLKRRRIFTCNDCGFVVTDQLTRLLATRDSHELDCPVCKTHILLLDREERVVASPSSRVLEMDRAADTQRDREAAKTTIQGKEATMDFDVFLCHNSIDKPAVKKIGEQLKEQGLLPWLDVWELRPGLPWQLLWRSR